MDIEDPRLLHRLRTTAPGITDATALAEPFRRLTNGLKAALVALNERAETIYRDSGTPIEKAARLNKLEDQALVPRPDGTVGYFRRELGRIAEAAQTALQRAESAMDWRAQVSEAEGVEIRTRLSSLSARERDVALADPASLDARVVGAVLSDPLRGVGPGLVPDFGGWLEAAERSVFPAETAQRDELRAILQLSRENQANADRIVTEALDRPGSVLEARRQLRQAGDGEAA